MTDTRRITANTAALTALKGFSLLLVFGINIYLARALGASGYGLYAYYTSIIAILSSLAICGTDRLLLREISSCRAMQSFGKAWGILRWSGRMLFAASLIIIAAALAYATLIGPSLSDTGRLTLIVGLPLIPLAAFMARGQASLQAVEHPVAGRIAEDLIQPSVFLLALIALMRAASPAPYVAMGIRALSFTAALGFIWFVSRKTLDTCLQKAEPDTSNRPEWVSSALRFAMINLLLIAHTNINIFMLQWMLTSHDVGIYAVAQRGADIINILALSLNITFTPAIVRLHHSGDTRGLQQMNARLTLILSAAAAMMALAFVAGGEIFLSLFGDEFTSGQTALNILAAGKCASIFFGPVALLLVMTGHEHLNIIGIVVSALANIILNIALIPAMGIEGAALASTLGLMVCCVVMLHYVRTRIGIHPSILANFIRR